MEIRQRALAALCLSDPGEKAAAAFALQREFDGLALAERAPEAPTEPDALPGRPARPELLAHTEVARRSPATPLGRAALMHAVAHIELNAINLALDAVWRFDGMPLGYYRDWVGVAAEEAHHFSLLRAHLQAQGHDYGDFPAHQGLWNMCERTAHDVVARMALVPRTLEARGLDATPPMQNKLRNTGAPDALAAVAILDVILRDEIGHVAIGNRWYRWLCERDGLEPVAHYRRLTRLHHAPLPKPPLNMAARRLAGFTEEELAPIPAIAAADGQYREAS